MERFTELNVDDTREGSLTCGPYHMNRHRIYFEKPKTDRAFVPMLFSGFNKYLNQKAAVVERGSDKFCGGETLCFTGSLPLPLLDELPQANILHDDWVYIAQHDKNRGFTGQTLRRNFMDPGETAALIAAPILNKPLVKKAIEYNQYHFLAGRRSWVIAPACDFDHDPGKVPSNAENLMVFETAAIERASLYIHDLAREVFDKQTRIIWRTLLTQYVTKMGLCVVNHKPWSDGDVETKNNVSYIYKKADSKTKMKTMTTEVCKRHKHLWP